MKKFTSILSTNDLIRLAKETMTPQDFRAAEFLMRSHLLSQVVPRDYSNPGTPDWNRQELIELIASKNGGTAPDDIVRNRDAAVARRAAAEAAYTPPKTEPAAIRRAALVVTSCAFCGGDTQVAEDKLDEAVALGWGVYCSQACLDKKKRSVDRSITESDKFIQQIGSIYYNCEANSKVLLDYLKRVGKEITSLNLFEAFTEMRPQLLPPLTADQIRAMTDTEFDKRARQEGSYTTGIMGGIDLKTLQRQKTETVIHSSNDTRTFQLPSQGAAR